MVETEKTERGIGSRWLAVDVGNTNTKLGVFEDGILTQTFSRSSRQPLTESAGFRRYGDARIAVASVYPKALAAFLADLRAMRLESTLVVQSDGSLFQSGWTTTDVETPETTGVDRVLGCLGASVETPGRTVVVVDLGTATTINVMTPDRCFRGGMIAPGRALLARSLHKGTAALPECIPQNAHVTIGKTTRDALEAGVSSALIGSVRESTSEALGNFPEAEIYLTGGDATLLAPTFPHFRVAPWLTLKGLYWYAANRALKT